MNSIKLKKLPDCLDIKVAIKNEIIEKCCKVCPFCGENKSIFDYEFLNKGICNSIHNTWYGKKDELHNPFAWLRFWEKNRHWEVKCCKCLTCGAEWESPSIPH